MKIENKVGHLGVRQVNESHELKCAFRHITTSEWASFGMCVTRQYMYVLSF